MAYTQNIAAIPLGETGFSGDENQTRIGPSYLTVADNIQYDGGNISKEGGSQRLTATGAPLDGEILGGYDWSPDGVSHTTLVYTRAGSVRLDAGDGSFATILQTGLSGSLPSNPVFITAGAEASGNPRRLFVINGVNPIYTLSGTGTSLSALGTAPADLQSVGPISGCVHNNRLWFLKDHRVYYSTPGNHVDFSGTGSGQLPIYPGVGQRGVQIMSFKGLLVVWKYPVGIFAVDTTDIDPANWGVSRISESIGAQSNQGAVMGDDDIIFVSQNGDIHFLSGIQEFGKLGAKNISQLHKMHDWFQRTVKHGTLHTMQGVYYSLRREVQYTMTDFQNNKPNLRLVVDFNQPALPRFRVSTKDQASALWLGINFDNTEQLFSGDQFGHVWRLDTDEKLKTDAQYIGVFQTAHMDLSHIDVGLAARRKEGRFLELTASPRGDWPIYCDISWDGVTHQTVVFQYNTAGFVLDRDQLDVGVLGGVQPTNGFALGSFILGSSFLAKWTLSTIKKRIAGGGKRVAFRFYTVEPGSDYSIGRVLFYYVEGNERVLR